MMSLGEAPLSTPNSLRQASQLGTASTKVTNKRHKTAAYAISCLIGIRLRNKLSFHRLIRLENSERAAEAGCAQALCIRWSQIEYETVTYCLSWQQSRVVLNALMILIPDLVRFLVIVFLLNKCNISAQLSSGSCIYIYVYIWHLIQAH